MSVRAAVVREAGAAPEVADIELRRLEPGQVRVRLQATGVCHSDLSLARGTLLQRFPAVLGHEGAGRVVETAGATRAQVGDTVVLNWTPPCRRCWFCAHGEPYLCERGGDSAAAPYATLADGTEVFPGLGVAAFGSETVVLDNACIRIPADVDAASAALLGCAVLTGVGAVLNAARVQRGESVVVFGLGGVGLCAVQGARIAGASVIIVVDPAEDKTALAQRLGATHALAPGDGVARRVRELTEGRGADHAIECVGRSDSIRAAWSSTRRGGSATIVGMGSRSDSAGFNALELAHFARTLRGCMYGSSDPERDIPALLGHVRSGTLDLGALVSRRIGLDGLASAFADLEAGRGARAVIVYDD